MHEGHERQLFDRLIYLVDSRSADSRTPRSQTWSDLTEQAVIWAIITNKHRTALMVNSAELPLSPLITVTRWHHVSLFRKSIPFDTRQERCSLQVWRVGGSNRCRRVLRLFWLAETAVSYRYKRIRVLRLVYNFDTSMQEKTHNYSCLTTQTEISKLGRAYISYLLMFP